MAFTTSGQKTKWAYSYSPGAHMGPAKKGRERKDDREGGRMDNPN